MIIFKLIADIHNYLTVLQSDQKKTGFAPTMGALHDGHISLLRAAKNSCDYTVSSIFVNPAQFNDMKDFEKYPNTLDKDIYMLEKAGCDILFLPSVQEIYPDGLLSAKHYDVGYLETMLEGNYRPGHFQGVCRVMEKLLTTVHPDKLYLGQKDYQQCLVINKLSALINANTEIIMCVTQREPDGLAMSSRNLRLTAPGRKKAPLIYESLQFIQQNIHPGYLNDIKERAVNYLTGEGFKVDYIEIANVSSLEAVEIWDGKTPLVALAAAFIGEVRLIDNLLL